MVGEAVGMMLDIRVGGCGQPGTPGLWVMGIKEVTHSLEDAETGERGSCPRGQGTLCPMLKAPSFLHNPSAQASEPL